MHNVRNGLHRLYMYVEIQCRLYMKRYAGQDAKVAKVDVTVHVLAVQLTCVQCV